MCGGGGTVQYCMYVGVRGVRVCVRVCACVFACVHCVKTYNAKFLHSNMQKLISGRCPPPMYNRQLCTSEDLYIAYCNQVCLLSSFASSVLHLQTSQMGTVKFILNTASDGHLSSQNVTAPLHISCLHTNPL